MICPFCQSQIDDASTHCQYCHQALPFDPPEGFTLDPDRGLYYRCEPGKPTLWYDPYRDDYSWDEESYEYDEGEIAGPGKKRNPLVIALVAVLVLGGTAYAAGLHENLPFFSGTSEISQQEQADAEATPAQAEGESGGALEASAQADPAASQESAAPASENEEESPASAAAQTGEPDPGQALNAYLLTLQGKDYSDSAIKNTISQQAYQNMLDYYGSAADLRATMLSKVQGFFYYLEDNPMDYFTDDEIVEIFTTWASFCEWTIDGFSQSSGTAATVNITITRRVNGELVDDELLEQKLEQCAVRDLGSVEAFEFLSPDEMADWLINVIIEVLSNPEGIGMIDTTAHAGSIEMEYNAAGGWIVADTDTAFMILFENVTSEKVWQ